MLRVAYVLSGALAVNLLLFLAMEQLASRVHSVPALRSLGMVDFVRLKREPPPPEVKERAEPPPREPDEALTPRLDRPAPALAVRPLVEHLSAPVPRISLPMNITGGPYIGQLAADSGGLGEYREPIPLVRTPPLYPPEARDKRIEGMVKVAFTVDVDGSVKDPVVVYSKPPEVFDRAVLSAIRHWKFESKVVDGRPTLWQAAQTITFRMVR